MNEKFSASPGDNTSKNLPPADPENRPETEVSSPENEQPAATDAAAISAEIASIISKKTPSAGVSRREHTRKTLVIYAVLMAGFVLVLILISYLNQMRSQNLLSETMEMLTTSEAYAEGIEKNIALLQEENIALKKQLASATARHSELQAAFETSAADNDRLRDDLEAQKEQSAKAETSISENEARITLLATYNRLLSEYIDRDYAACREIIAGMEQDGSVAKLTGEYLKKYEQIKRRAG